MSTLSSYELDIEDEPNALRAFAEQPVPSELRHLELDRYDRIVLTGMGASHFSAQPTWVSLGREGRPVWWVSAAQLLDLPDLVTSGTLLWVTSQSGESGEVVALVDPPAQAKRPRTLVATTNVAESTLAQAADIVVVLHAGVEASVSTKSYVTTLAAHERALGALRHEDDAGIAGHILAVADELGRFSPRLAPVVSEALGSPAPRFAFIAGSSNLPSALLGALTMKEAAKLPAEGYMAGEFRHGPIELAGPGLTALLFGSGRPDRSLAALGRDLQQSGAFVLDVDPGPGPTEPGLTIVTPSTSALGRLVCGAKLSQLLSVGLARARGLPPGEFRFGQKVTTAL